MLGGGGGGGGGSFTKVAAWRLELPVEAGLGPAEAALLVGVFAVEGDVFPVWDHGVGHVEGPALHPGDDHAAPHRRDEAAGCQDARVMKAERKKKIKKEDRGTAT